MNTAELKLALFRKIDSLNESELEKVYNKFVSLLNSASPYKLSEEELSAINDAVSESENSNTYTSDEVMKEARRKYPNLDFK